MWVGELWNCDRVRMWVGEQWNCDHERMWVHEWRNCDQDVYKRQSLIHMMRML